MMLARGIGSCGTVKCATDSKMSFEPAVDAYLRETGFDPDTAGHLVCGLDRLAANSPTSCEIALDYHVHWSWKLTPCTKKSVSRSGRALGRTSGFAAGLGFSGKFGMRVTSKVVSIWAPGRTTLLR